VGSGATSSQGYFLYALRDNNGDFLIENNEIYTIYLPDNAIGPANGVAYYNGSLFTSTITQIWRYDNIDLNINKPPIPHIILNGIGNSTFNSIKWIKFVPDGLLYLSVGANCDNCNPNLPYGAIYKLNPDGSNLQLILTGVRNSLGFDWHPITKQLWFTDIGKNALGPTLPPEEINTFNNNSGTIPNYGNPYCYGNNIPDLISFPNTNCSGFIPSSFTLPPHSSPAGITFYSGSMYPSLLNKLLICEYGSSNIGQYNQTGYQLSALITNSTGQAVTILTGFLTTNNNNTAFIWGRPTDIIVLQDGSFLISDDKAGAIYRISALPSNTAVYILILVAVFLSTSSTSFIIIHNFCIRSKSSDPEAYTEIDEEKEKTTLPNEHALSEAFRDS